MSMSHTLYDLKAPTLQSCSTVGCEQQAIFVDRSRTVFRGEIVLAFYSLCYDCAIRLGFTESNGTDEQGYKTVTKLESVTS